MAKFRTVIKLARFVYSPYTATEMQGFAQVLADSIRARIQSGQNIYDQAAAESPTRTRPIVVHPVEVGNGVSSARGPPTCAPFISTTVSTGDEGERQSMISRRYGVRSVEGTRGDVRTFDVLVLGRYESDRLVYVARTRVGFTSASRERLMERVRPLEIAKCPFVNLPRRAVAGRARALRRRR